MSDVLTTTEMRPQIVCPLLLKIAEQSAEQGNGGLGGIVGYKSAPTGNGWTTRLQKGPKQKDIDMYNDVQTILHGSAGEFVTLSDKVTQIRGLGLDEKIKSFKFTHEDGKRAKARAIDSVKRGILRAPKNWDKVFSDDAGVKKSDLETMYPELYTRTTRSGEPVSNVPIEPLHTGWYDDDEDYAATLAPEDHLDDSDDALIAQEEKTAATKVTTTRKR